MKIDGQCHCGVITYEAEVDPERVYVCHCTDCQAISGGTFRWAVSLPEADFRLLSGEPTVYSKRADNGRISHQFFCATCASPLYGRGDGEGPQEVRLRLGTARQRADLKPKVELWCGSAQDWVEVQGPTERLDKQ